jgi:competence protein CoiA
MEESMRYANVNGERSTAAKGLIGLCPACNFPVVPKCGSLRAHHWAHRSTRSCDRWWEPLTKWHRDWQDRFPEEWREQICYSPTGEKHIADIRTPAGFTIEIQHSFIDEDERRSRELFYGNMAWIVDGARLKRDFSRFKEGLSRVRKTSLKGFYLTPFPEKVFSYHWITSSAPVFFDFSRVEVITPEDKLITRLLWGLLPDRVAENAIIVAISHDNIVKRAITAPSLISDTEIQTVVRPYLELMRKAHHAAQVQALRAASRQQMGWRRRRYPRF